MQDSLSSKPTIIGGSRVDASVIIFGGFLTAGFFKADPTLSWLPVDLTVLLAAVSCVLGMISFFRGGMLIPKASIWVAAFFCLLAVPMLWTTWTPYAVQKVTRLFSLTFLAAFLPTVLIRNAHDMRAFIWSLFLFGALVSLSGVIALIERSSSWTGTDRLAVTGSNTISLGRACGIAIICTLVYGVEKRLPGLIVSAVSISLLGAVMIAAGSRGPILALTASLILGAWLVGRQSRAAVGRFGILVGLLMCSVAVGVVVAPSTSRQRVVDFFTLESIDRGLENSSVNSRQDAIAYSIDEIASSPLGHGWGGFQQAADAAVRYEIAGLDYPHNILLEVFFETGWVIGLLVLIVLVLLPIKIACSAGLNPSFEEISISLFVAFLLGNALVSGEVNDNRMLYACLGVWLARSPALPTNSSILPPSELRQSVS